MTYQLDHVGRPVHLENEGVPYVFLLSLPLGQQEGILILRESVMVGLKVGCEKGDTVVHELIHLFTISETVSEILLQLRHRNTASGWSIHNIDGVNAKAFPALWTLATSMVLV